MPAFSTLLFIATILVTWPSMGHSALNAGCQALLTESVEKLTPELITHIGELKPKDTLAVKIKLREELPQSVLENLLADLRAKNALESIELMESGEIRVQGRMKSLLRLMKRFEITSADLVPIEIIASDGVPVVDAKGVAALRAELLPRLQALTGFVSIGMTIQANHGWVLSVRVATEDAARQIPIVYKGATIKLLVGKD